MSRPGNRSLVWYTDGSKTNEGTGAGVYKWGPKRGHSFSPELHITEIQVIRACIMENIEKGYKVRNIYILFDRQAAIKELRYLRTNSNLAWDIPQSLVKLAEHNRVQLIWVPGHMGIDGNEMADQLAREGFLHPLIGLKAACGISAAVARGVIRGYTRKKHKEFCQSTRGQR